MRSNSRPKLKGVSSLKLLVLLISFIIILLSCQEDTGLITPTINDEITSSYLLDGNLVNYLQNVTVTRYKGNPGVTNIPIGSNNLTSFNDCFILYIANGSLSNIISRAVIKLDGQEVLNTSDFSNKELLHKFEVCNLSPESILEVTVLGVPGSYLDIWMEGKPRISVITAPITNITNLSAVSGGIIINNSSVEIIARGVCFSSTEVPTIEDYHTTDGAGSGEFISIITVPDLYGYVYGYRKYYVRAYASTNQTTYYGNTLEFRNNFGPCDGCETGTVSDIVGNIYNTVRIGDQWWMSENLKTTKLNDGTPIINRLDPLSVSIIDEHPGAYCWYNHDVSYSQTYGALYNWKIVNTGKLCPEGWHVSSLADWIELRHYLERGWPTLWGGPLKTTGTIEDGTGLWYFPNEGATNHLGFNGIPGGQRSVYVDFCDMGTKAYYLMSTRHGEPESDELAQAAVLYSYPDDLNFGPFDMRSFASVRCVKDN
jgi:uncharacterized protein (TIGR02145 family)